MRFVQEKEQSDASWNGSVGYGRNSILLAGLGGMAMGASDSRSVLPGPGQYAGAYAGSPPGADRQARRLTE